MPKPLPIPPRAKQDPHAFELLRVWAAQGQQQVSIHAGLEGGPAAFGEMLAELAEHGAQLYAQRGHGTPETVAQQVQDALLMRLHRGTTARGALS